MARNAFGIEKDALTTGEVARICNVAARTVSKWIDAGRLEGYRIPGSRDRRVHVAALEAFVAAHGIPVTGNALATANATRILVVDADRKVASEPDEVIKPAARVQEQEKPEASSGEEPSGPMGAPPMRNKPPPGGIDPPGKRPGK